MSPIKVQALEDLLIKTSYNKSETEFLVNGFKNGFHLGYEGPMNRRDTSDNIQFTPGVGNKFELWEKIMKEVKLGRFLGPWKQEDIPFKSYVQSPVGLVPKSEERTRLIFHLSYKFKNGNESINYWIPKERCSVKYNDIDHAVYNCLQYMKQMTRKSGISTTFKCLFFGKTDLSSAFRLLPMGKTYWKLLVLKAEDPESGVTVFFADKCMPFGASISCSHFQRLSNALKHMVKMLERAYNAISNYLDDFLFIHYVRLECNRILRRFIQVCEEINFPVALEKTEFGTTIIIFLGVILNGMTFTKKRFYKKDDN